MAQSARGRLAYVMVEAYQNIIRHRAPDAPDGRSGRSFFLLRCQAAGQQVLTMNPVVPEQATALRSRLARIQGRDKKELKDFFMEGLQRAAKIAGRGAGLGLIEMARRSNGDPAWSLIPEDDGQEMFTLSVRLGKGRTQAEGMREAVALRKRLLGQGIDLFHSGYCSEGVKEALARLADHEPGWSAELKAAIPAAMGLMPDAAAGTGPGVFMMGHEGERPVLLLGLVGGTVGLATDTLSRISMRPPFITDGMTRDGLAWVKAVW